MTAPSRRTGMRLFGLDWRVAIAACLVLVHGGGQRRTRAADLASLPEYRAEQNDGAAITGRLIRITPTEVVLATPDAGDERRLAVETVRTVELAPDGRRPGPSSGGVRLTCIDGTTLDGDDFTWLDGRPTLVRAEGRVELPIERVRTVAWRGAAAKDGADTGTSAWLAAIPEDTGSDLVVVGKADGPEFVECAITAITADAVTVVLDGETIPVKRAKVLGLHWLREREAVAAVETLVDVAGGSLRAGRVAWTPEALVLDGDDPARRVSLPAAMLARIDYSTGRTTSLTALPTEQLEVDPFFGALAKIDGLADFFAPRVAAADSIFPRPGLVVRPRTVAVWRIPANARRFRTTVAAAAGKQATDTAIVAIAIDGREVFRRQLEPAESIPIDVELTGGRRLSVTVDFGNVGTTGGAVRFTEPVIEK